MAERTEEKMKRVFAHVRVHGLGASMEERERGGDRPVVLCDEGGQRVVSVSPAAWERGVRPGMSRWEAERRCPEMSVAEPDREKYAYFRRQIADICGDYTPEVRVVGGDDLSLDLSGNELLFGPAKRVGQEIRNRLRVEVGVTASIGVGPNRMVARLACESAGPGEVVEVGAEERAEFVGGLPVSALPGVNAEWAQRLSELGIRRAKDLAALPETGVERALGEWGRRAWEIARGEDPEEGREVGEGRARGKAEDSLWAQVDLRPVTEDRERIRAALLAAAEEVGRKLRQRGQVARQVRIGVVFRDLRRVGARRTLREPTRSSEVIFQTARSLFERMKLNGRLVRRVRVSVGLLSPGPRGGQMGLPLLEEEARRERLAEMVDRIKDRFGETAVRRASAAESTAAIPARWR